MPTSRAGISAPHSRQPCKEHLGVGATAEDMAARLEHPAQHLMIVDLAIEGDDHRPVFGRHGLRPTGQVHDGQPPVAEAEMRLRVEAFSIRPAMALRFGHRPQAAHRRNRGAKRME